MVIFSCKDRFEDMMTCIYDAWVYGISSGHDQVQLRKESVYQQDLFHEYIHVSYDQEKTEKVIRSIRNKISWNAYISVFYACLSMEEDALQAIYDFLRLGFKVGAKVLDMQNRPEVMRIWELRRRIGNESTYFHEFARFTSIDSKVYLCHIEPKNNVLLLVADHFAKHWYSGFHFISKRMNTPICGKVFLRPLVLKSERTQNAKEPCSVYG